MSTALVPLSHTQDDVKGLLTLGSHLAKSGFFADARDESKAVAKILAGREYGFAPIVSMSGIHIIEGKLSIGANLLATLIKRSENYRYKVVHLDRSRCELQFLERDGDSWGPCGPNISMTMDDAKGYAINKDGILKKNWKDSPDDMLFARCISKGFRRYCPDLTGGMAAYTEGEIEPSTEDAPPVDAAFQVRLPDETVARLRGLLDALGQSDEVTEAELRRHYSCDTLAFLSAEQATRYEARLTTMVERLNAERKTAEEKPAPKPQEQPAKASELDIRGRIETKAQNSADGLCSDLQNANLVRLIRESKVDPKDVLKKYQIKAVNKLPEIHYSDCVSWLEDLKAKAGSPPPAPLEDIISRKQFDELCPMLKERGTEYSTTLLKALGLERWGLLPVRHLGLIKTLVSKAYDLEPLFGEHFGGFPFLQASREVQAAFTAKLGG